MEDARFQQEMRCLSSQSCQGCRRETEQYEEQKLMTESGFVQEMLLEYGVYFDAGCDNAWSGYSRNREL